jgi:hypothetical protein
VTTCGIRRGTPRGCPQGQAQGLPLRIPEERAIPARIVDSLREGKAPNVIRRKGAAGELPVSLEEKIEILALLSEDRDETIRNTAFYTLQALDALELQQALSNPTTSPAVLDFVVIHLAPTRQDLAEALLKNPRLPDDIRASLQALHPAAANESGAAPPPAPTPIEPAPEEKGNRQRVTLLQKINAMTPSEKIKAALTGNMEERLLLIRDSNKLVARAVLGSPKLTDQEIENIASMKNVTEEVLRLISTNRKFMKSYAVVRQLINNPRSPIDVGLHLLNRLNDRDLKGLLLNKNVAEVVRGMALKMIKQKADANKPKLKD